MKVGIVTGAFDLLHAGHIQLFKQAKLRCDHLIVALQVDPSVERDNKHKPIESIFQRQVKLNTCKYVDKLVIYEDQNDLELVMKYFMPDVRFLGSDYKNDGKNRSFTDICPVEYIDSLPIHTSGIRERIKNS